MEHAAHWNGSSERGFAKSQQFHYWSLNKAILNSKAGQRDIRIPGGQKDGNNNIESKVEITQKQ
jgi:hypothetical protein